MIKLISLHLPKTAGLSFGHALKLHFVGSILEDYSDGGLNKPAYKRYASILGKALHTADKGIGDFNCIHGHFFPFKYLLLSQKEPLVFVTWMRHPVERLISHYYYWKHTWTEDVTDARWNKCIEEKWTVHQFCMSYEMQNLYSKYLWGFPLRYFHFIGITEHFEEDLEYFGKKFLNKKLNACHKNTGKSHPVVSYEFRKKIEEWHKEDMELYERALRLRERRLNG